MIDQKTQEVRESGEPTSAEVDEVLEEIIIAAAGARSSGARPLIIEGDHVRAGRVSHGRVRTGNVLEVDRERLADLQPFLAAALEVFDPSPSPTTADAIHDVGERSAAALTPTPPPHGTDERPFA